MGILRRLRQWREKTDGTLTGPAISAEDGRIEQTSISLRQSEVEVDVPPDTWFQSLWELSDEDYRMFAHDIYEFEDESPEITEIEVQERGTYYVSVNVTWADDTNWETGDELQTEIEANGSRAGFTWDQWPGATDNRYTAQADATLDLEEGDTIAVNIRHGSDDDRLTDVRAWDNSLNIMRLG